MAFNVGDTVRLKSGGPIMTVSQSPASRAGRGTDYRCQWFAGKKLEAGSFEPEQLDAVKPEPPANGA